MVQLSVRSNALLSNINAVQRMAPSDSRSFGECLNTVSTLDEISSDPLDVQRPPPALSLWASSKTRNGPLVGTHFRLQWALGEDWRPNLKLDSRKCLLFLFFGTSIGGQKMSVKLRKKHPMDRLRMHVVQSICVFGICSLPEEKCALQKCVYFSKKALALFVHCVFHHLRHVKNWPRSPFSGKKCVVCLRCCLCLWRVPWSVKCVTMTCFAQCL